MKKKREKHSHSRNNLYFFRQKKSYIPSSSHSHTHSHTTRFRQNYVAANSLSPRPREFSEPLDFSICQSTQTNPDTFDSLAHRTIVLNYRCCSSNKPPSIVPRDPSTRRSRSSTAAENQSLWSVDRDRIELYGWTRCSRSDKSSLRCSCTRSSSVASPRSNVRCRTDPACRFRTRQSRWWRGCVDRAARRWSDVRTPSPPTATTVAR